MPAYGYDALEQTLREALSHIRNAGAFNEGQPNQVSGDQLPPEVKQRVDQLAALRNSLKSSAGPETQAELQQIQVAINNLYNPQTRAAAMSSWSQLHGDENNPWSATGGHLGSAASIVNSMTTDPDHYLYGGRRP